MHPTLTERRAPWVVFTPADASWLQSEISALRSRGGAVFRLNGRELSDPHALFTAFARELDFPGYFGHNWDALVDCLHDRHHHGAGTGDAAILIDHADGLLDADFLGLFVSVLCQAAWHTNLRLDADGTPDEELPPLALHFVFLLDETPPSAFTDAVAAGMDVVATLEAAEALTATLTEDEWPPGVKE
ncbi:barstar family protein [Streptomyces sp. NPDC050658]|uniref:barstar family protein n=1 Tax=unclassified Streptomyces TaxID=2593676 RepID=UPI003436FA7A